MSKTTKLTLILATIFIAISGTAYSLWMKPKPAPSYAAEVVRRGNIESAVLASGMLQASKLVSVGAQVSGQITKLKVKLGDHVKKGELIAEIDDLTQQNALKEARASLASLRAQYQAKQAQIKQATQEFKRQKAMLADHASSKADYESAESNLAVYKAESDKLKAEIDQAKVSVDSAKVDLGYTKINAPMDGTVVYTAVEVGQTVNANQSTPTIVEIANLDTMTVKAQISEADVINTSPGQSVYFTILGNASHRYEGKLESIEPGPTSMDGDDSDMTPDDDEAVYYNALFNVANPKHTLRIGMTAQVTVVLKKSINALLVPSQVLTKSRNGTYTVPVLKNHQIQQTEVQVGINNKVNAEIVSGLSEGEKIVVGMPGGDTFTDKMRHGPMGF
ncbi:efflux RND transporter periplasmic adaptor subunit [Vibrio salinus]|uniref:efflux RND transporter periplasmic adaptor subunit n=1 Tax=Vibrio salinus TaxID=2899784 RepID=UPI001E53D124|nr:efflux RND transporter periplasmic adaptor subunit [Vibrio salinus]MCE0496009.1 efflux RND transporter periplasmic adaptor subunit [Vibrio salinus]